MLFGHCDLDLSPKVTNFNSVRGNAVSNYLAKTASKSVYRFDRHFVHKRTHTHTHTDRQTDPQTNLSENITLPRFRGSIKMIIFQCPLNINDRGQIVFKIDFAMLKISCFYFAVVFWRVQTQHEIRD